MNRRNRFCVYTSIGLLLGALLVQPVLATTYISAEPIPSGDVVGADNLAKILNIGYSNLEAWSNRLLTQCQIAESVIHVLSSGSAIGTVNAGNTSVVVGAGGFEAVTDPSYVFTVRDSGPGAASAADVGVLDNALGYVLSQGGTVHFNPGDSKAYDFPLDYAVVSFSTHLTGLQAKAFFDYVGTIDAALWSGTFAGFTQIDNSMLFLKPATTKQEFITGLSSAAGTYPGATYGPLNHNGQSTTAKAGVAFPGNDWIQFPGGNQYLTKLGNASPQMLSDLASLRQQHLQAVASLLKAIDKGNVSNYLNHEFKCPR